MASADETAAELKLLRQQLSELVNRVRYSVATLGLMAGALHQKETEKFASEYQDLSKVLSELKELNDRVDGSR